MDTAVVALAIGLYGAALSTYTAVIRHREGRREQRRNVVVTASLSADPADMNRTLYRVTAVNTELRPVEITKAGVVKGDETLIFHWPQPVSLPARLGESESVTVDFAEEWIALVRASTPSNEIVAVAVMDSRGEVWRSERWAAETGSTE